MPPTRNRRFAAARPALNLIAVLTCALLLGAAESAAGASTTTCDIVIRDGTGRLKAGYHADVVVFDPKTVIDRSTFAQPHQLAIGVKDVLVNGGDALQNGHATHAPTGRFVHGRAWTGAAEGGDCRASASDWSWAK